MNPTSSWRRSPRFCRWNKAFGSRRGRKVAREEGQPGPFFARSAKKGHHDLIADVIALEFAAEIIDDEEVAILQLPHLFLEDRPGAIAKPLSSSKRLLALMKATLLPCETNRIGIGG
jgi:hypothetical protein